MRIALGVPGAGSRPARPTLVCFSMAGLLGWFPMWIMGAMSNPADFADFQDHRASAPTLGIPFRGESLLAVFAAVIGVIVAVAAVTTVARKPVSYAFQEESVLQAPDSDEAMRAPANEHPVVIYPRW